MKTVFKALAGLLVVFVVCVAGVYVWAGAKSNALLARTVETHRIDFPIPFPLTDEEAAQVRAERTADGMDAEVSDEELANVAMARAIDRGQHLVESRYVCVECHGQNFGGGTMIDAFPIGTILGPNITTGQGGRTAAYTAADWDRAVRHGVKPDGSVSAMPSEDFMRMSDQELSDVVAYIRSRPTVDADVARPTLGPLGKVLLATGQIPLSADRVPHTTAHLVLPPMEEATASYGQHLAGVCMGCHNEHLTGGPVPGGDPSWPPSANLTSHADGLAGWTYEQFATALNEGTRPDGTALLQPMASVIAYTARMTDVERQALWAYLQSIPAAPTPK